MLDLKEKIKEFPKNPGIYQFIGENGIILYIGKAKSLRNRVKSYFAKEVGRGPGIDQMVRRAIDIKYYETESEIEAVILEADLISKLKPKYNIRQKDDKSFLAIKITKEDFPRVGLVRFRDLDVADKSAEYFGPYPSGDMLKRSMRYLRRIFPFRDCTEAKYAQYSHMGRPCLYGDIGVCDGPCSNQEVKEAYNLNIKNLKNFLRGKKRQVIADLEKEMAKLSQGQHYEAAAVIRNRLRALDHLRDVGVGLKDDVLSPTAILFRRIECYDIANISGQYSVGSMVVFRDGLPDKDQYRKFKIKKQKLELQGYSTEGDTGAMVEVLERRLKNDWPLPNLIIIDGGLTHLNLTTKILKQKNLEIPVVSIAKGPKRDKNEFHFSNGAVAEYFHLNKELQTIAVKARNEAHRFAGAYYRKLHSKEMLK
jgi:excinuclease ABC subunit C